MEWLSWKFIQLTAICVCLFILYLLTMGVASFVTGRRAFDAVVACESRRGYEARRPVFSSKVGCTPIRSRTANDTATVNVNSR